MMNKISSYFRGSNKKKFYYNIAGTDFTIDDIKHGMLRGNRVKPGHFLSTISESDTKRQLLANWIQKDPRINFVCLDFPDFVEHI